MSEQIQTNNMEVDSLEPDEIRGFFEASFDQRSFNPLESDSADSRLQSQLEKWREASKTIVFSVGCYDLFHANHRTYLLHTKLAALKHSWASWSSERWEDLDNDLKNEYAREALSKDLIKLVVSVDGNKRVAASKSFNPEKGGSARPIYDWKTRSRDVLSAGFELKPGSFKSIVDAVTIHDDNEPVLIRAGHANPLEVASLIQPDIWSVFEESEDIISAVQTTHADSFKNTDFKIIPSQQFYGDKLLGGSFSTTAITRRIGGSAMNGAS